MIKKGNLYILLLFIWAVTCLYFDVRLFSPFYFGTNLFAGINIVFFAVLLNIFWFYGLYHLIFTIFSFLIPKKQPPILINEYPKVVILYTTRNDFQKEAVLSCLNQVYRDFKVFILDDSDEVDKIKEIDNFILSHDRISITRRQNKNGFKAGNLNNALQQISLDFEYFAVCDSDTILPPDFLKKTIPYFKSDDRIAFVQANQTANLRPKSLFASILSFNTDLHWKFYVPVKEKYGFMMFYGHGAIIRIKAWKEAGGFPEIATEDLAFSSVLREKGYYGVFANDVVCYEEFPINYKSLRRRNKRWSVGTLEYLDKYYLRLLLNKQVPWMEKADILISACTLLLAPPFLLYILVAGIILPYSQHVFKLNIPLYLTNPPYFTNIWQYLNGISYKIYWTKDFFAIMLITVLGQLIPVVISLANKPLKLIRYSAAFTFICISSSVSSTIDFLEYLLDKKALFHVTGDNKQREGAGRLIIVVLLGILLAYYSVVTGNLWLFIIAFCLLLDPLLYKYNLEQVALNKLIYLPFFLNIALLILIGRALE